MRINATKNDILAIIEHKDIPIKQMCHKVGRSYYFCLIWYNKLKKIDFNPERISEVMKMKNPKRYEVSDNDYDPSVHFPDIENNGFFSPGKWLIYMEGTRRVRWASYDKM